MIAGQTSGTPFHFRVTVAAGPVTVVPAVAGCRAVINGISLSANFSAASTVSVRCITSGSVAMTYCAPTGLNAAESNGLWIPADADSEGWEIVTNGAAVVAASISVWGVYVDNNNLGKLIDANFAP